MIDKIDGFLGRLAFRTLGVAAALLTVVAAYAAYQSLVAGDGIKSIVVFVMFGAGALIAGFTTRYCFSRERTFGEFIEAVEGGDGDIPVSRRRG